MDSYQGAVTLLARILLSCLFFWAALYNFQNWSAQSEELAKEKMPMPVMVLAIATGIEVIFGATLAVGFWSRWSALILALYTVPCAFAFNSYWKFPKEQQYNQQGHWWKDLAVIGGLLMVFAFGPGPISVDESIKQPPAASTP